MPQILSWRMVVLILSLVAAWQWFDGQSWPAAAWFGGAVFVWIASGCRPVFQFSFRRPWARRRREFVAKVAVRRVGGPRERGLDGVYRRLEPGWRALLDNGEQ